MSETPIDIQELLLLASQMLDGTLAAAEVPRLEAMLAGGREARRWYYHVVCLHATLQWRTGVVESAIRLDEQPSLHPDASDTMIVPAIRDTEPAMEISTELLDVGGKETPAEPAAPLPVSADSVTGRIFPRSNRPLEPSNAPVVPEAPEPEDAVTLSKAVQVPRNQTEAPSRKSSHRRARSFAIAASIILVISLGIIVAMHFNRGASTPTNIAKVVTEPAAALTGAKNAQWQTGFAPRSGGAVIGMGEELVLTAGSVEIAFQDGASVVVEAPSHLSINSAGAMNLDSGKIAAVVPPRARGFTVTAPGVVVKDLGTEFGLQCGQATNTEIDVFKGTVEARTATAQSSATRLVAGDASTVSAGALIKVASGADIQKFPRHFQGVNLPPTFSDADIANPPAPGSAVYSPSDASWTIRGIGEDIWHSSDQLNLASEQRSGDATIVCRIKAAPTDAEGFRRDFSKCGAMYRSSVDPGSPFVAIVRTETIGIQMIARDDEYSDAVIIGPHGTPMDAPCWVKLSRVGDEFTGSCSRDGVTWTTIGTHVAHLPATGCVGLAVTSGDNVHPATATFTNVATSGGEEKK